MPFFPFYNRKSTRRKQEIYWRNIFGFCTSFKEWKNDWMKRTSTFMRHLSVINNYLLGSMFVAKSFIEYFFLFNSGLVFEPEFFLFFRDQRIWIFWKKVLFFVFFLKPEDLEVFLEIIFFWNNWVFFSTRTFFLFFLEPWRFRVLFFVFWWSFEVSFHCCAFEFYFFCIFLETIVCPLFGTSFFAIQRNRLSILVFRIFATHLLNISSFF